MECPYDPEWEKAVETGTADFLIQKGFKTREWFESNYKKYLEYRSFLNAKIEALEDYKHWTQSLIDDPRDYIPLESNDTTRLHSFKESLRSGFYAEPSEGEYTSPPGEEYFLTEAAQDAILQTNHTFVVKHDWLMALGDNIGEKVDADFRLPYDRCAFEFKIHGKIIICLCLDTEDQGIVIMATILCKGFWLRFSKISNGFEYHGALGSLCKQIRVICIALDAQVASKNVVRQPEKLNAARVKQGKLPLYDYHVVDLIRKPRAEPDPSLSGAGAKKRLHFRRGHWRHLEERKVWINWMLVGDPDLGFIDKHYRL